MTTVGSVATAWAQTGHWGHGLTVIAVGLTVQRAVAFITPNKAR